MEEKTIRTLIICVASVLILMMITGIINKELHRRTDIEMAKINYQWDNNTDDWIKVK